MVKRSLTFLWHMPRNILIGLVWIYQKTLSPDHSFWAKAVHVHGFCKYQPTCSQYMKEALRKYGAIRGLGKGVYRIMRCNPWSVGGVDRP